MYAFGRENLGIGKTSYFDRENIQETGTNPYILVYLMVRLQGEFSMKNVFFLNRESKFVASLLLNRMLWLGTKAGCFIPGAHLSLGS